MRDGKAFFAGMDLNFEVNSIPKEIICADAIDTAIQHTIKSRLFTREASPPGSITCTTDELGDFVAKEILSGKDLSGF